ncbi:formate dehydrogenase accessory protein FdhE [bacterium]|nr:formate dehydrogenase accessory protein FdhE [bacterium]
MTKPESTTDNLFQAEMESISEFTHALDELWQQFDSLDIFESLPQLPGVDAARERLRQGESLCVELPAPQQAPSRRLLLELLKLYEQHLPERVVPVQQLRQEFEHDASLAGGFVAEVLANDARAIIQFAIKRQVPEDLITLLALHAGRPWRNYFKRNLPVELEFKDWQQGKCPVCGHRPAMSHIDNSEGHRTLWCMHCDTRWSYQRIQCAFCGSREQEQLEILHPEQSDRYRCQACGNCKRFIKEVRTDQTVADFPFDQIYLATGLLDQMGWEADYIQDSVLLLPESKPEKTKTNS